jgi:16S rRNA (cytosine1402-N4)-methyltransferase
MHVPVLLNEVLAALDRPAQLIDGTLGAGGHTRALLTAGVGAVLGLDCDPLALDIARTNLAAFGERAQLVHASYTQMAAVAGHMGWGSVGGILLDLGLSSMQLDSPERGFAFQHDGPLDMRFDPWGDQPSAADLVNTLDERELAQLFYSYGEEPHGRRLARVIVAGRPYYTTRQLAAVIEHALPKRAKIHPATRVFQALRIAVNRELDAVAQVIPTALDLLEAGGRLAIISFHSLEDRIVKTAFKLASTDCICPPKTPICVCGHQASVRLVTRKPITVSADEVARNPRSRSAKLRVVEKLGL